VCVFGRFQTRQLTFSTSCSWQTKIESNGGASNYAIECRNLVLMFAVSMMFAGILHSLISSREYWLLYRHASLYYKINIAILKGEYQAHPITHQVSGSVLMASYTETTQPFVYEKTRAPVANKTCHLPELAVIDRKCEGWRVHVCSGAQDSPVS